MYFRTPIVKRIIIAGALPFALMAMAAASERKVKNVILMIADGRGFNTLQATEYYTGQKALYESFAIKYGMQTYSAGIRNGEPGSAYSPAAMAKDFRYALKGATDSASAATALYTGVKVYDHEINYTPGDLSLATFFEKATKAGKSIGAISSVHWTHATPAAVFAHNKSRMNYESIAKEAIYGSNPNSDNAGYDSDNYNGLLKVIMGPGNPSYDNDARLRSTADYRLIGGEKQWKDLGGGINGWTLITTQSQFEALARGRTPDKIFGIPQAYETLQYNRSGIGARNSKEPPYSRDRNTGVPDLATMTKAALNVLDNNKKGFAVMIEGGAIDWANHANQAGRMIEEQMDFNKAVEAVVDYLNQNTNGNNWGNTLLVITSDHESGYLWGDGRIEGSTFFDVNGNGTFDHGIDYAHVKNNGAGKLPDVWFHSGNHSNSLVPFFAKGAQSDLIKNCEIGIDTNLKAIYKLNDTWTGKYIDNTCVFRVLEGSSFIKMEASGK
jgi:alkaline phosphatase